LVRGAVGIFWIISRAYSIAFVAMIWAITAIVGSAMVHTGNAHLGSLVVLSLMFPLFIKFFQTVSKPTNIVVIAFILIAFQCIFFSHESLQFEEEWDYLVIPGFGLVPRLAILGFVSNSLGLMLFPFYVYFLHQARMSHDRKVISYLFAFFVFVLIILTFSRTAFLYHFLFCLT
jgi:Na+-translocating ferredoxin:NAD+ oxidoreductase RnfE subunit